ncbi:MAG: D-glycero-beta-D-manno-heptose 1-phosphate adenylyltransferase [Bacteroidia bacterium]
MHSKVVEAKIFSSVESLFHTLNQWRFSQKKVVFTNGCFDILHLGHIDYLTKAADKGDILVIGLNSDRSVSEIKGNKRPINNETSRAHVLASLAFVKAVVLFDEPTPYELIKFIQPDVLVKGADYKIEEIVGFEIVKAKGGEITTLDFLSGYSTSGIEQKIVENHSKS